MADEPRLQRAAELLDQATQLRERAQELVSEAFALIAESRRMRGRFGPRPPDDPHD